MIRILIIDPNGPFRQSLKEILLNRFSFIDIEEASDGDDGLEKIDAFHPNLIFCEIHLPQGNGLDLARKIKARYPDTIIVVLTSYDSPEYQIAAEESGVDHLVPKDDWTGEDIIALVRRILWAGPRSV
jgi:DNA-binding NarL/FixJ family response regulator